MGRGGQKQMYATNAEKQAAYRARNRGKQPPLEREILWAARRLVSEVDIAAIEGDVSANVIRGRNSVETLQNLRNLIEKMRTETDLCVFPDVLDDVGVVE